MTHSFPITGNIAVGGENPVVLIAGPCVIEGEDMLLRHAERIARIAETVGMPLVFKASYDKANRTSGKSFRGPGLDKGLRLLEKIKREMGLPLLTDAHNTAEMWAIGEVVDIVQVPAFLCRQTDMLSAAAETGKVVNVKKGQFCAPEDALQIIAKVQQSGGDRIMITERGSSFGYRRLVVDFIGLAKMREYGWPIVFDATHSVQTPSGQGETTGGESRYAPQLAYAAAAVGIDALFVETHENPAIALSDGPNMIPLDDLTAVLERFLEITSKNKTTTAV